MAVSFKVSDPGEIGFQITVLPDAAAIPDELQKLRFKIEDYVESLRQEYRSPGSLLSAAKLAELTQTLREIALEALTRSEPDLAKEKQRLDDLGGEIKRALATPDAGMGAWTVDISEDKDDLDFKIKPEYKNDPPPDQTSLKREIEKTLLTIRTIFPNTTPQTPADGAQGPDPGAAKKSLAFTKKFFHGLFNFPTLIDGLFAQNDPMEKRLHYVEKLRDVAVLGISGNRAQTREATSQLDMLRLEILQRESNLVKNAYLWRLGWRSFTLAAIPALLYVALYGFSLEAAAGCKLSGADCLVQVSDVVCRYSKFLLIWSGCMAGVWLSVGTTREVKGMADMVVLEDDRWDPTFRLILAGLLSMVVGLTLAIGLLPVQFGSLPLASVLAHPTLAMLLGLVCGFSEKAMAVGISTRTKQLADRLAGAGDIAKS